MIAKTEDTSLMVIQRALSKQKTYSLSHLKLLKRKNQLKEKKRRHLLMMRKVKQLSQYFRPTFILNL